MKREFAEGQVGSLAIRHAGELQLRGDWLFAGYVSPGGGDGHSDGDLHEQFIPLQFVDRRADDRAKRLQSECCQPL